MARTTGVLINLASQAYVTLIGLFLLPVFRRHLGEEGFGLLALSMMLQAWFGVLDFGMAPTVTRVVATFRAGRVRSSDLLTFWKTATTLYLIIGIVAGSGLASFVILFGQQWVNDTSTTAHNLIASMLAVLGTLTLRWFSELFRAAIIGNESFIWLGCFSIAAASARFLLLLPIVIYISSSILLFFLCQLLISVIELSFLVNKAIKLLPAPGNTVVRASLASLAEHRPFILSVAFAGISWAFVTQIDKLLLSGLLSLADYGRFSLAVFAASAITLSTTALSPIIMSHLSILRAQDDANAFNRFYAVATQWLGLLAWPSAALLFFYGEQIIWVWTGDQGLSRDIAQVVRLYAFGNAILAISSMAYFAQFSKGSLRLHVILTGLFLAILIPAVLWSTKIYGAVGAAWTWATLNAAYLLTCVPVIHRYFVRYPYRRWLFCEVLPMALLAFGTTWFTTAFSFPDKRLPAAIAIVSIGLFALITTLLLMAPGTGGHLSGATLKRLWSGK